ncbi:MAG: hypothetical protein ABJF10_17730 [Chthoniobacter sp.]|uniref:hypothetical protein n=1 Tax=Chthoniobacter sp. TaxID=2510640 RepID=UPI0032AB63D2
MRCSKCGGKVKYVSGGHGNSEPPGCYFWVGIVALIVTLTGFGLGHTWVGYGGLLFAVPLIGWAFVARGEGYGNRCTACDQREKSYPWSL